MKSDSYLRGDASQLFGIAGVNVDKMAAFGVATITCAFSGYGAVHAAAFAVKALGISNPALALAIVLGAGVLTAYNSTCLATRALGAESNLQR